MRAGNMVTYQQSVYEALFDSETDRLVSLDAQSTRREAVVCAATALLFVCYSCKEGVHPAALSASRRGSFV